MKKCPEATGHKENDVNQPNSTLLDWALQYAQMGWPVLPVNTGKGKDGKNNKAPVGQLVPNGKLDATTDPATLEAWFNGGTRNLAILPPTSVLVLDFDEETAQEVFFDTWPELERYPAQKTPSGGMHVFMRVPANAGLTAKVKILEGLDLRGLGTTYTVATPSQYDGQGYEWVVPLVPVEDLPMVPNGLIEYLKEEAEYYGQTAEIPTDEEIARWLKNPPTMSRQEGMLETLAHTVSTTAKGARRNTLRDCTLSAGGLIPYGMPAAHVREVMTKAGFACGLVEQRIRPTVNWAISEGRKRPLNMDRPEPTIIGGTARNIVKFDPTGTAKTEGNVAIKEASAPKEKGSALNDMKALVRAHESEVIQDIWEDEEEDRVFVTTDMGDFPITYGEMPDGRLVAKFLEIIDPLGRQQDTVDKAVTQVMGAHLNKRWPKNRRKPRITSLNGVIYLDTIKNGIIAISPGRWELLKEEDSPKEIKWRREELKELPIPTRPGGLEEAKALIKRLFDRYIPLAPGERAKVMLAAFSWYMPDSNYYWLNLVGDQSSGKSSKAEWLLSLIDPAERQTAPLTEDGAKKEKANHRMVLYDNVEHATAVLASTVDVSATRGAYTYRSFYKDRHMVHARIDGAGILTSLEPLFAKVDTNARCLVIRVEPLENPEDPEEINPLFEAERPQFLGAMLTLVAEGLRLKADPVKVAKAGRRLGRMKAPELALRLVFPEYEKVLDQALADAGIQAGLAAAHAEVLTTAIPYAYCVELREKGEFEATSHQIHLRIKDDLTWLTSYKDMPANTRITGIRLGGAKEAFKAIGIALEQDLTKRGRPWKFKVVDKTLYTEWYAPIDQLRHNTHE